MRRTLALAIIAACLAVSAAAQESEAPQPRVLQWLGLGGSSPADPPQQATPAQQAAPAQAAATPPPTGQEDSKGPGVLRWFGLGGRKPEQGGKPKGLDGCPEIVVEGADLREPAGADASAVRYQLGLRRMARDCALHGDAFTARVGIEGSAMLGPAGQPGSYHGDLRVALRRKSDAELFGAKTYRVGADIPSGAARGDFTLLVEDLEAPLVSAKTAEDYEIIVGFTSPGGSGAPDSQKKPARRKRH